VAAMNAVDAVAPTLLVAWAMWGRPLALESRVVYATVMRAAVVPHAAAATAVV